MSPEAVDLERLASVLSAVDGVVDHSLSRRSDGGVTAFVVIRDPAAENHIRAWTAVFDRQARSTSSIWRNSYDGGAFTAEEMQEWVDTTVERLLAFGPRRVLDVGCGTGLLLSRLAPVVEQYIGVDASRATVESLRRELASGGLGGVDVSEGRADDIARFRGRGIDLVVVNSVVQYLPSLDHLRSVVRQAVHVVAPRGTVVIGDVRSLPVLDAFHLDVTRVAGGDAAKRRRHDPELVVHPSALVAIAEEALPGVHAEAWLRRGHYQTEMTRFRFDLVVSVGVDVEAEVVRPEWRQWGVDVVGLDDVVSSLRGSEPVGVVGLPNARIVRSAAALDPEDVWRALGVGGWEVRLSWGAGHADGSFDVVALPPPMRGRPVAFPTARSVDVAAHEPATVAADVVGVVGVVEAAIDAEFGAGHGVRVVRVASCDGPLQWGG